MSRNLLFGAHSVSEWLAAQPARIEAVLAGRNPNSRVQKIVAHAQQLGVPVETIEQSELKKLAHPKNPQGIAARVHPFPYRDLKTVVEGGAELLLAVDSVTDTGNLGAIIRSAAFFGVDAVVIPKDRSATITPFVERAAAGAVARIAICQVNSLLRALEETQAQGFAIVGSIVGPHPSPSALALTKKMVLVVGSEDRGIRPSVRRICDQKTALPTHGPQSLNVSAFTSVLLYEIARQRSGK